MFELKVTLETVTPMFMGGANPRGSPEIRAPSVRGALRYWLRAVLDGTDLELLKTDEGNVFGNTKNASAVTVRIQSSATTETLSLRFPGLKYLLFSMQGDNQQQARQCFSAGEEIQLQFKSFSQQNEVWKQVCVPLWLLTRLGGLGARARRGAGGLQAKVGQALTDWPDELPPLEIRADNARALATELKADLGKLRHALGVSGSVSAPTEYDILAPGGCRIWVLNPDQTWRSWAAALGTVGMALQKGRSLPSRKQIQQVRIAKEKGTNLPDIGRAGLGLPIVFHDKRLGHIGTLQAANDESIERRASPLHIRVIQLNTQTPAYTVVLTEFKSRFAPDNSQLTLREKNVTGNLPDPAWIDNEFWPAFDKQSKASRLEVRF